MKRSVFSLFLSVFISVALSAGGFNFGAKINLGASGLNCGTLSEYIEAVDLSDNDILEYSAKSSMRFGFNLGGYLEYLISGKMAVRLGLNYLNDSGKISIHSLRELDLPLGYKKRTTIDSTAVFKFTYISVPLSFRYNLGELNRFFVVAGFDFKFPSETVMESEETVLDQEYDDGGALINSEAVTQVFDVDIHTWRNTMTDLSIGAGMVFPIGDSSVEFLLKLNLPLSKRKLYTYSANFTDKAENNEVFTEDGYWDAYSDTGKKLDDYSKWSVMFTVGYRIGSFGARKTTP